MPTSNYWWRQHRLRLMAGFLIGVGIAGLVLSGMGWIPFGGIVAGVSLSLISIAALILVVTDRSP